MPVAVPPYSTQSRIVTKIDELFSDLDAGVASLERAKAKLKRYRAAVLKAAVEGKLTEEWRAKHPPKETASQLLERILKERRRKWEGDQLAAYAKAGKKPPANWKDKYKEPQSPNATDLPELPDGWCWASIDQVAIKVTDGEHLSPKTHDTGVFLLSAKDVREHGVVFDDPKYVGLADAHHFRQRCDPDKGDILIVSRGATIGRSTVVQSDEIFCLMGSVILLKPSLHIDSHYLVLSLKSVAGQKQLVGLSGSTAQQAIYIRDIRPLALPIAPILEQHQIISEVERRLSLAHESESEIEANLKRSSRLRQSILKRAFEGKLVPQDSNDEPACVLVDTFCRRQDSERR
jgi:type I restriction enzyme S subunit